VRGGGLAVWKGGMRTGCAGASDWRQPQSDTLLNTHEITKFHVSRLRSSPSQVEPHCHTAVPNISEYRHVNKDHDECPWILQAPDFVDQEDLPFILYC